MQIRTVDARRSRSHSIALGALIMAILGMLGCDRDSPTSNRTHDFGTIVGDHRIAHRFSLPNDSGSPWAVEGTSVSCTCLEVRTTRDEVPAGDFLYVDCTLDTTGTSGELDRHIAVRIKVDGRIQTLDFYTTAFVKGPPVLTPSRLQHEVPPGEDEFSMSADLMLPTEDINACVALGSVSSPDSARVLIEPLRRRGRARHATIRVNGSLDNRRSHAFEIVIRAEYDGTSRDIVVPASVLAGSAFRVSPGAILIARKGTEPARAEVAAAVQPGFDLRSARLEPANSGTCRFETSGLLNARILLEVPPAGRPTGLVLTGSRGESESVPVRILEP